MQKRKRNISERENFITKSLFEAIVKRIILRNFVLKLRKEEKKLITYNNYSSWGTITLN